jgi:hypothetical protein
VVPDSFRNYPGQGIGSGKSTGGKNSRINNKREKRNKKTRKTKIEKEIIT